MVSYANLVRNNRQGGSGGWRAQLRASQTADPTSIDTLGDPDWEARQFDTQSMVPSAYAEKQREAVMRQAADKLKQFGSVMSAGEYEQVAQIAETGVPRQGNFFMNLLNIIDTPAELLRLGISDIFNVDKKFGVEIEPSDYLNAALGRESTVRESLGQLAGDGQFVIPGSNIAQAAGATGAAKPVLGFAADVLLDPLNAVSFGAVGLGKKAIAEGAQAATATAAKRAAQAVADNAVDGLVGLERTYADAILTRADEAGDAIFEKLRQQVDNANPDELDWMADEELLAQLRETARELGTQAEITAARIGAEPGVTDDISDFVKAAYDEAGLTHAAGDLTNDITQLVANKRFGTLEDNYREFIDYEHTPTWVTGGMKLVSPFFRKSFPAIDIGFRNDASLRSGIEKVLERVPGKAGQAAQDMLSKFDAFYGPTKAAMEGQAWSLRYAENAKKTLSQALVTGAEATGALRATLTDVHTLAAAEGLAPEVADSHLIRLMGSADAGAEAQALTGISEELTQKLLTSASTIRGVLVSLREAATDAGLELGNIENYFPMLASKEFRDTVDLLATKAAKITWDDVTDPHLRMGRQLLSELVASAAEAKKLAQVDQGSSRFALQRTVSRHVFQLLGTNIEMADLQAGMWAEYLGRVSEGYLTHAAINDALKKALTELAEQGQLSRRVVEKMSPYSEDVGEVLDTYVGSIGQVINYRHFVRELKRIGLMGPASRRIHAGDTMAETLNNVGPAGRNMIEELISLADQAAEFHGERAARTTSVRVAQGWTVDVPTVVLEDPRFQTALNKLRKRYETAMRHMGDSKARTAAKAKEYESIGVPPQLARQFASAMTDVEMSAALDEISQIAHEQAEYVLAGTYEILATATDTIDEVAQEKVLRAARKQADAIRREARKTLKKMRAQWSKQFSRDVTEEIPLGTMDLLGVDTVPADVRGFMDLPPTTEGQPILRRLAFEVKPMLDSDLEVARHAKLKAASDSARDLMADNFRTNNVTLGQVIDTLSVPQIEKLWEMFKLKGHFTDVDADVLALPIANFVERLDLRSIWQIDPAHPTIDDTLWELWRASFRFRGQSKAAAKRAAKAAKEASAERLPAKLLRPEGTKGAKSTRPAPSTSWTVGGRRIWLDEVDAIERTAEVSAVGRTGTITLKNGEVIKLDPSSAREDWQALASMDRDLKDINAELANADMTIDDWVELNLRTPEREAAFIDDMPAVDALRLARGSLEISLRVDETHMKAMRVLQAMRESDVDALLRQENRQGVLHVLERFGINTDFVHFTPEGGIVWRPLSFEDFHDEVDFDSAISKLREMFGTDTTPRSELLRRLKELTDDQLLESDPEVRLLADMLGPDGKLPFELDEYENLLDLVRDLKVASTELATRHRVTQKMIDNKELVEKRLTSTLREIQRVSAGGAAGRLRKTWTESVSDLKRLLPSEEFDRLNTLVAYMQGTARLGGPGHRIVERNIAETRRIFQPLNRQLDDFNAKVAEIEHELIDDVGQPFTEARETLRAFQLAVLDMWQRFGPEPGASRAVVFEDEFDEAFREVRNLGKRASKAVETVREGVKGWGREGMPPVPDLPQVFGEDVSAREAMAKVAEHLASLRASKVLTSETGRQSPAIAGLAGDILGGQVAPPYINAILEQMAAQIKAVSTPLGLRAIAEETRQITKWWKAAATVARPTFVPRNLIGGVINGRIIGVGLADYGAAFGSVSKMRRLMEKGGLTPRQALAQMDASERDWLTALFDSELLFSTYASTLKNVRGANPVSVKPWSEDFALFRAGGAVMQKSEDWLRAAAFHRHYDPSRPETMQMAKQLALEVHFDYSALTKAERTLTNLVPFFVWTRRNIPLQIRVMLENPGFVNKYQHFITEADEYFDGEESVADDFPGSPHQSGLSIETDFIFGENTPFWSRLILSPDVPLKDLEDTFKAFLPGDSSGLGHVINMMNPGISAAFQAQMTDEYPNVNAPFGLSAILRFFAAESPQGDVRVPYALSRAVSTAVPFLQEYANLAGIRPSDPRAQARLGYQEGGEPGVGDSLRGAAVAAGRAAGASLQTPGDALGPIANSRDFINDLMERMRFEGRIQPTP